MKTFLRLAVFVAAGCLAAASSARADKRFRLGAILGLSGPGSSLGEACRNAALMARDSLPPAVREGFEIVFEDDQLISRHSVSAAKKLLENDRVDALLTFSSGSSHAAAPLAEKAGVPMVAIASDPKVVEGRSYTVNLWVSPEEEARVFLAEIRRRGLRRIARVSALHDGTLSVKRAIDRINRKKGIVEISPEREFTPETSDFRPFLARLKRAEGVEAIHINLFFGQAGLFARQAREMGISTPFISIEVFEDREEVKSSNGALIGQWYVNADDPSGAFVKEYLERFPGASLYTAANCHDAVMILGRGVEQGLSREGINRRLHTLKDFSGALGVYSATGDNRFSMPAAVKVVTPSGFERAEVQPQPLED